MSGQTVEINPKQEGYGNQWFGKEDFSRLKSKVTLNKKGMATRIHLCIREESTSKVTRNKKGKLGLLPLLWRFP